MYKTLDLISGILFHFFAYFVAAPLGFIFLFCITFPAMMQMLPFILGAIVCFFIVGLNSDD